MTTLLQDLRYGLRMLRKHLGFTAVAVLSLALGIGPNTAIFSLVDALLLKTLPVKNPDQLFLLARVNPAGSGESFTYRQFEQFRDQNQVFSDIFAFAYIQKTDVSVGGQTDEALVQLASDRYFSALGIHALRGRTFSPSDEPGPGGGPPDALAVISYEFWKRRFGLDPSVVGKSISINGVPFIIVGVTPPEFFGVSLDYSVDVWTPITMQPQLQPGEPLLNSDVNWVRVMARANPGISPPQAAANLNVIFQQSLRSAQAPPGPFSQRVELVPGGKPVSGIRPVLGRPLTLLTVIVALILLIACANVANLLLARAAARQREITMRVAIGAGRGRLIRQLLTESILLALLGGALGTLFAMWGSDLLLTFTFNGIVAGPVPLPLTFHTDLRVLAFTALVSVLAGTLFGLAPAWRATRVDLSSVLKENASGVSGSGHRLRLDKFLLIAQLAVSLLLLIAAGLFVRSFQKLADVDLGFNPKNVVQLRVDVPHTYSETQRSNLYNQLLERIQATPGIISAAMSLPGVFTRSNVFVTAAVEGPPQRFLGESEADRVMAVSPGFFAAMGIPQLQGRDFGPQDHRTATPVALLNQAMARRYFPDSNPIGKRLYLSKESQVEIVGVVKDAKYNNVLTTPTILYIPLAQFQHPFRFRQFAIRTAGDATGALASLRQAVQAVDSNLLLSADLLTDLVEQSLRLQHLIARLTGFLGLLGLLLACVGVYGLMSYAVVQRTGEIGLRMALGAQPAEVLWLMLREAMRPVLIGAAIGLGAALMSTRLVSSLLFGLTATDPLAIALATLLMLSVAALAGYLPARRAARVDPMVALRHE